MTEEQIKAAAYKAAECETGRREFNCAVSWLVAFTRIVEAAERERIASRLDAEHEKREDSDNHAAVYARMIRESK